MHPSRVLVWSTCLAAAVGCQGSRDDQPDSMVVAPGPAMVIPFNGEAVAGGLSPYGVSNLVFEQALPPSFLPVRVHAPFNRPTLVATWASGAGTIIEPLTERPGSEVQVLSVEAANVTGGREVDLVFSYNLVRADFVERRVVVCSIGGCTAPVRLQRSTPKGEVLWTATVGFPSPGLLNYERGNKVNRALLNPSLWLDR